MPGPIGSTSRLKTSSFSGLKPRRAQPGAVCGRCRRRTDTRPGIGENDRDSLLTTRRRRQEAAWRQLWSDEDTSASARMSRSTAVLECLRLHARQRRPAARSRQPFPDIAFALLADSIIIPGAAAPGTPHMLQRERRRIGRLIRNLSAGHYSARGHTQELRTQEYQFARTLGRHGTSLAFMPPSRAVERQK